MQRALPGWLSKRDGNKKKRAASLPISRRTHARKSILTCILCSGIILRSSNRAVLTCIYVRLDPYIPVYDLPSYSYVKIILLHHTSERRSVVHWGPSVLGFALDPGAVPSRPAPVVKGPLGHQSNITQSWQKYVLFWALYKSS